MSQVASGELLVVEYNDNELELTLRAIKGINLLDRVRTVK